MGPYWKIIIKHRNKHESARFKCDGEVVSDKKGIADDFNKFYVSVGLSFAKKISNSDICPTSFISEGNVHSMGITAATKEELFKVFRHLKHSSADCDDIAACVILMYCQFINTEWHISERSQTSKGYTLIKKMWM